MNIDKVKELIDLVKNSTLIKQFEIGFDKNGTDTVVLIFNDNSIKKFITIEKAIAYIRKDH